MNTVVLRECWGSVEGDPGVVSLPTDGMEGNWCEFAMKGCTSGGTGHMTMDGAISFTHIPIDSTQYTLPIFTRVSPSLVIVWTPNPSGYLTAWGRIWEITLPKLFRWNAKPANSDLQCDWSGISIFTSCSCGTSTLVGWCAPIGSIPALKTLLGKVIPQTLSCTATLLA